MFSFFVCVDASPPPQLASGASCEKGDAIVVVDAVERKVNWEQGEKGNSERTSQENCALGFAWDQVHAQHKADILRLRRRADNRKARDKGSRIVTSVHVYNVTIKFRNTTLVARIKALFPL